MKAKVWIISWLMIVVPLLGIIGYLAYHIDPYFHYHKPDLEHYYYTLSNPRCQNDGIVRHFDYNAMITGTSMTQNFRTTEADRVFDKDFIKVVFRGGTYKEINDNINTALKANPDLKTVIRCLDIDHMIEAWDAMRSDLGKYPTYLYDDNPWNDIQYLLNRDVLFGRTLQMILDRGKEGFQPGITPFDEYERTQEQCIFGINHTCPYGIVTSRPENFEHLSEEEREELRENIEINVLSTADAYPDVDFYYFYSPYSIDVWSDWYNEGTLFKILEAEAFVTEMLLPYENIHLFSFHNRTDIITDLNHYHDGRHYAAWINSLILKWIHDGEYRITPENYQEYRKNEYDFFSTFDFESVNGQEDYAEDDYAAALLNEELTGAPPLPIPADDQVTGFEAAYSGQSVVISDVDLDKGYRYLCFTGTRAGNQDPITVSVCGEDGETLLVKTLKAPNPEEESHLYVVDLSTLSGTVSIVMSGGEAGQEGNREESPFTDIILY